jgi:hypothetical protein
MGAVILARIGPVKPLLFKSLIAPSEASGRTADNAHAQPRARAATHAPNWWEPGRAKGAHRDPGAYKRVSAVSAEIVDGTVPVNRFSLRSLCRNMPVRTPRVRKDCTAAVVERTGPSAR